MDNLINTGTRTNFPCYSICNLGDTVSTEALIGSSYGKLERGIRRRAGKSSKKWYAAQLEFAALNWAGYNCGGVR